MDRWIDGWIDMEVRMDKQMDGQSKQDRIHGVISRVLLGRGSNKAVYTSTGARLIITDRLQR